MIITDLDGTFFGVDGWPTERTIAAVRAAHAAGVEVVAATGRSHWTARPRLAAVPEMRWLASSNGAVLYDRHEDRVVGDYSVQPSTLSFLFDELPDLLPDIRFGWEAEAGFHFEADFGPPPQDLVEQPHATTGPVRADLEQAVKVFVSHPRFHTVELCDILLPLVGDRAVVSTSGAPFVEVTAPGVDKAHTAALVAARVGVDRADVVALGDHVNDLSLLTWAGTGVAMGNAIDEVKATADHVAGHHAEDGWASWVEARLRAR